MLHRRLSQRGTPSGFQAATPGNEDMPGSRWLNEEIHYGTAERSASFFFYTFWTEHSDEHPREFRLSRFRVPGLHALGLVRVSFGACSLVPSVVVFLVCVVWFLAFWPSRWWGFPNCGTTIRVLCDAR